MRLEILEVDELQRGDVRGREPHARRDARIERLRPARDAQAPAVARFESGKFPLRRGRGKIVAALPRELQKFFSHLDANGVKPDIAWPGLAETVAVKAGHRRLAAALKFPAEHIGLHGTTNRRWRNVFHHFRTG